MWHREYRDYKTDKPLIQYQVYPGDGIIGCEMHDLNGWGNSIHKPLKKHRKSLFATLLEDWLGSGEDHERS